MDIEFVDMVINKYKSISSDSEKGVFYERGLLARVRENVEWESLTDDQKHKKRCFVFSVIKKTGNSEVFLFETRIILLYELVESLLLEVYAIEQENELKIRLIAMLEVFKYHVNKQRDTRKMNTTSFKLLRDIATSCKEVSLFNTISEELNKLIGLIEALQKIDISNIKNR